jgi:hypothetical protein
MKRPYRRPEIVYRSAKAIGELLFESAMAGWKSAREVCLILHGTQSGHIADFDGIIPKGGNA